MGMFLGPEGALAGLLGGGVIGERGHIAGDLHTIGSTAKRGWDDIFGGGGSSSSSASHTPFVIHNHVTVEIDGKQVTKAVVKHHKQRAASN